jgi:hypothetical protein
MRKLLMHLWLLLFMYLAVPPTVLCACLDDTDCGLCQICLAGLCVPQADSEDMKDECPESDCSTGFCNGRGGCGFKAADATCADDGYSYTDDICDGAGTCVHPVYQWVLAYKGDKNYLARSVCETSDGGYIVAGYTSPLASGNNDLLLVKLNNNGSIAWQKTYGGTGSDYAYTVVQTLDGGYMVAGYTHNFSPVQNIDTLLLKIDKDGGIIWQKTYGGNDTDIIYAADRTREGGYIIAGYTNSFGEGGKDILIMNLSSAGDIIWQKVYGTSQSDEEALSVQQTIDGGFVVAGNMQSCSLGLKDILVLKLNQQGDVMWKKLYGQEEEYDYVASVKQTPDGGYIIGGYVSAFDTGGGNAQVIRTDSSGTVSWHTSLAGNRLDRLYSLDLTMDGGYVLGGASWSFGLGGEDLWIVKLTSIGVVQWQRTYGGESDDIAYDIRQTTDGGYIVAGRTSSFAGSDGSGIGALILKIGNDGGITRCGISAVSTAEAIRPPLATMSFSLQHSMSSLVPGDADFITGDDLAEMEKVCFFNPVDGDDDGIATVIDNCPDHYNRDQNDTFPPGGNGIGDACDCEGNFNCSLDLDTDGSDASTFKANFGRGGFIKPCTDSDSCNGDFSCDGDVDGTDASLFKQDFGRSTFLNPCPVCFLGMEWCNY